MSRDPLDELIEDLDQKLTADRPLNYQKWLADFYRYTDVMLLYGSEAAKERLEKSPQYRQFLADWAARNKSSGS